MSTDELLYKVDYLSKQLGSPSYRHALESKLEECLKAQALGLPKYIQSVIFVDLLYALHRNAFWQDNPFFIQCLLDFLCYEYELPEDQLRPLIKEAVFLLNHDSEKSHPWQQSPLEFLRYVITFALSPISRKYQVATLLGLGQEILNQISEIAKCVQEQHAKEIHFFSTRDQDIFYTICELSEESQKCPWVFDRCQLSYYLVKHVDVTDLHAYAAEALEILLAIGIKHLNLSSDSPTPPEALLSELQKAQLIYPLSSMQKKLKWALSLFAYEVTAQRFAQTGVTLTSTQFATLPGPWQDAYLSQTQPGYIRDIVQTQSAILSLDASGLECLLQRPEADIRMAVEELLPTLAQRAYKAELREKACQILSQTQDSPKAQTTLTAVAQKDTSLSVQNMARFLLHKTQTGH